MQQSELLGAANLADLILSRSGKLDFDWDNLPSVTTLLDGTICQNHYGELIAYWHSKNGHNPVNNKDKPKCAFPEQGGSIHGVIGKAKITKQMAADYFRIHNQILPIGSCK